MMLYRIESAYPSEMLMGGPLYPDPTWLEESLGTAVCKICHCVNRAEFPKPLHAVLTGSAGELAIAAVEIVHLHVFRCDLMTVLADSMSEFVFGRVAFKDSAQDSGFVTCYCAHWITVHGGLQSCYAVCPQCGGLLSNLETSPEFVLAKDIDKRCIYQDFRCRLYLTEQTAEDLNESRWDQIVLTPIPVHEL